MKVTITFTSGKFLGNQDRLTPERVEFTLADEDTGLDIAAAIEHIEHHLQQHAMKHVEMGIKDRIDRMIAETRGDA